MEAPSSRPTSPRLATPDVAQRARARRRTAEAASPPTLSRSPPAATLHSPRPGGAGAVGERAGAVVQSLGSTRSTPWCSMEDTNRKGAPQQEITKGKLVAACMLQQSMFTFAGVGIGLALGLQRRNLRPFIYCISAGTLLDATYGYQIACKDIIRDYNQSVVNAKQVGK